MADRGAGLRVFRTKQDLATILEDLEGAETESEEDDVSKNNDDQMLSQLRHFVIQVLCVYTFTKRS